MTPRRSLALVALAASPFAAHAADLFSVSVAGPLVTPTTVSGNKIPDLLEGAIKGTGAFSGTNLTGNTATITLTYAGIANAITVDVVASPSGSLTGTLIVNNRTLTTISGATSSSDLQTKMTDYLTSDEGLKETLKAMKALYARTQITITDGTPHSSTATVANREFDEFGLRRGKTRHERALLDEGKAIFTSGIALDVAGDTFTTKGGYSGRTVTAAPTFRFGDRFGLVLSAPVRYVEIEKSQSAESGLLAGLPLQFIAESKDSHLFWQVTPHVHALAAVSADIVQAGLEVGGGVTNRVGYNFGGCTVQIANQLGHFQGLDIQGIDSGVKQQILKNGVSVSVPLLSNFLLEGRAVRTDFLKEAPVKAYYTFGADLVYRSPGSSGWLFFWPDDFYIGAYTDRDFKDYASLGARTGIKWTW